MVQSAKERFTRAYRNFVAVCRNRIATHLQQACDIRLQPLQPSEECDIVITAYLAIGHSFRSASLNAIVRSTLPVKSKTRISPERKQARLCA
jgi:hypothetical protein